MAVQADCETAFDVQVVDVEAGTYEVDVDGAMVGDFEAADDGTGVIAGGIRFDPTPEPGEEPFDFPVGSGSLVEIFEAGADRDVDEPVLSGTLPSSPPWPYNVYLQGMIGDSLTNLCTLEVE